MQISVSSFFKPLSSRSDSGSPEEEPRATRSRTGEAKRFSWERFSGTWPKFPKEGQKEEGGSLDKWKNKGMERDEDRESRDPDKVRD